MPSKRLEASSTAHSSAGYTINMRGYSFRKGQAKLKKPPPDSFVGDIEAALREEVFYVSITQGEPGIEPYCVADDFKWKPIALKGNILHPWTLLQGRRQRPAELM